jgi:methylated-DNA-[protein]-cysteine S-methyltransferase
MYFRRVPSPLGVLVVAASGQALECLGLPRAKGALSIAADWTESETPVLDEAARQLAAYFAGTLRAFDLPLAPEGTPFQLGVWAELARIPYGSTISYSALAERVGRPRAVRAVGLANGRNPLPIVLPCHRVIGADGSLTGYGGGLAAKQFLLRLEGAEPAGGQTRLFI